MNTQQNSYLLDTHYADFIKNYLSESYPQLLLKMQFDGSLDNYIIELAELGSEEYETYLGSLPKGNEKQHNTNHLMAKEYAYNALKELIENKMT